MRHFAPVLLLAIPLQSLFAEERIETDRHDFTQAPTVVSRGRAQLEFGYSYFEKSSVGESETSHTTPETLLRIGVMDNLEFRIRYNEAWRFGEAEHLSGSEDLRVALKTRLSDQFGIVPESALEIRSSVPTGDNDWSTGEVEFGLDYIYGWRINESLEFYGSTGFATNALGDFAVTRDDTDDNFLLYTQSVALGWELTETSTLYFEFFGLFTDGFEDNDVSPVFFNVGQDFFFGNSFVLDIRVGYGLNDDADDFFCGIGGGVRF